jgi:diacylglycerol kinase family enzyme
VKTLENLTGAKIRVKPEREVHLQLDGDAIGLVTEVQFDVVPKAITFRL